MINAKPFEQMTCTRVFYRQKGSEKMTFGEAFFTDEAAAALFVRMLHDLGWEVSINRWKWEISVEL